MEGNAINRGMEEMSMDKATAVSWLMTERCWANICRDRAMV